MNQEIHFNVEELKKNAVLLRDTGRNYDAKMKKIVSICDEMSRRLATSFDSTLSNKWKRLAEMFSNFNSLKINQIESVAIVLDYVSNNSELCKQCYIKGITSGVMPVIGVSMEGDIDTIGWFKGEELVFTGEGAPGSAPVAPDSKTNVIN